MQQVLKIYGAGLAGLACAITLKKFGLNVEVFEKLRYKKLFNSNLNHLDDVQVVVIKKTDAALLEQFLNIKLKSAKDVFAFAKEGIFKLRNDKIFLARKGFSPVSLNNQLYQEAIRNGIKFHFGNNDLHKDWKENKIIATGEDSKNCKYKIFGYKYFIESDLENGTVIVDFDPISNEYLYIAKYDDITSCILLSKKKVNIEKVYRYFNTGIKNRIKNCSLINIKRFTYGIPKVVRHPYKKNIIGTKRGINDDLLFFGLSDSIVDGINFALQYIFKNYNPDKYLKLKNNKNSYLRFINKVKELFCLLSLKHYFADNILKSKYLSNTITNLVSTEIPMEMSSILMGFSNIDLNIEKIDSVSDKVEHTFIQ